MIELQSGSLHFSKHIVVKYAIFRKSVNLPALIFLRLFGKGIINKVTNIYRTELINNRFGLHLNFYLRMISRLNRILSHNYQSKKLLYSADYGEIKLRPRARTSSFYSPESSDPFSNVIERISRSPERSEGVISYISLRGSQSRPKQSFMTGAERARQFDSHMRLLPLWRAKTGMTKSVIPCLARNPVVLHSPLLSQGQVRIPASTGMTRNAISHSNLQALAMTALTYGENKLRKKDVYNPAAENVYFHNRRKIEQEVEEIKKIVAETKEAVAGRPAYTGSLTDTDIKKHFDINRISGQVYQNIERRIKIERERRGL